MGWGLLILFVAIVLVGLWRFGGLERSGLEIAGAAMLLAVAGYAWQGRAGQAGSPTESRAAGDKGDEVTVAAGTSTEAVLKQADAFLQLGHSRSAASLYQSAIAKDPKNPDLWVGLGQTLTMHGGQVSPAAEFAFQRAAQLDPTHPGPPFFLGLALAQAGKFDEAGEVWRGLLARAPANAPWRADLETRLAEINQTSAGSAKPSPQTANPAP